MIRSPRLFVLLAASSLALGACKKKAAPVVPTPTPSPAPAPATPVRNDPAPVSNTESADAAAARIFALGATISTSIVSRDGARCASFSAARTDGVSAGNSDEKSVCSGRWNAVR